MKNNSYRSFKSVLSLAIVFAIFTGLLTGGVVFSSSSLSPGDGIETLINEAQKLSLEERNAFVNSLTQSQLDTLRNESKDFTKNQKELLLDKLNRNDNFDVLVRNILLADKNKQLSLNDIIYKLENRAKNNLEKFIKEAIFLTSVNEKSETVIRFIVNDLYKITEETYLVDAEKVKDIFLGMSKAEIEDAFLEYAKFDESRKEEISTVIMILNQEDFDVNITGFESIAYDINDMIMHCEYDNLGTKMLLKIFEYFSNVGVTYVVYDKDDDIYKVKLSVDLPSNMRSSIDKELQTLDIMGRDIETLDDLLEKIEKLINKHSETEIYNFKKFLNDKFARMYSGDLPVPNSDSNDDPVIPPPSEEPSDVNGDGDKSEDNNDIPPVVTPEPDPEEIEELDKELPSVVEFTDIENHWAKEHIIKLAQLGIVSGYTDGSIKPNDNITRAEMVVILVKVASLEPAEEINLNFVDKDDIANWAAGYIQTAVDNNIIAGYEDNTFRPSKNLTREEMVVLIIKASGIEIEQGQEPLAFTDVDEIGSWALDFVAKSVELDIVSGYSDNTFKPKRNVTRAETFTVLDKILDKK